MISINISEIISHCDVVVIVKKTTMMRYLLQIQKGLLVDENNDIQRCSSSRKDDIHLVFI